jgi:hypothetical protein
MNKGELLGTELFEKSSKSKARAAAVRAGEQAGEGTEVPDLKNGASEPTERTKKN